MMRKRTVILNAPPLMRVELAPEARVTLFRTASRWIILVLFLLLGLVVALLQGFSLGNTLVVVFLTGLPGGLLLGALAIEAPRPLVITERGITWASGLCHSYFWHEILEYSLGDPTLNRRWSVTAPTLTLLTNDWRTLYLPVSPPYVRLTTEQMESLRIIFARQSIRERSSF